MSDPSGKTAGRMGEALGLFAFVLVATAQVSNMARGLAGSVPPFSLAFFRWSIVAIGLSPLIVAALSQHPALLHTEWRGILLTGFLGMFVCGGPIYVAGITTSAITLALIMAMSPLLVLLFSLLMRLEKVNRWQVIGMLFALVGAVLIITRGQTSGSHGSVAVGGDLLVVCAMLAWAGYSLVQNRIGAGVSFLARVGMFAAAGALFSLPLAVHEIWNEPAAVFNGKAAAYLFAGLMPGLFAYGAYSWLATSFGVLSTSLTVYLGPVVGALLSIIFLGEPPNIIHLVGGALSLGGMWLSLRNKSAGPQQAIK